MKLSPLSIFLLGLMVALIALGYGYFQEWGPNMADKKVYDDYAAALEAEANKMPQAKKRVEDAKTAVKEVSDRWQNTVAGKTPPSTVSAGGINLEVNRYDLTVHAQMFRDNMQRAVNWQAKAGGVTVLQGPQIPAPSEDPSDVMASYFNYPAMGHPVAVFDLGQIQVRGTFDQIATNIRSWSNMPNYLAVADGLVITGTSPSLVGTYNLTLVAFIRGKHVSPQIPTGAAAPAGGVPNSLPTAGSPSGTRQSGPGPDGNNR